MNNIVMLGIIVFVAIFSLYVIGSKIVDALPTFPPEILNELLKSKSLINGTLTQEQTTEIEKNPTVFMTACHSRIIEGLDAGKVCDAAFKYLSDKCERLDNVLPYCSSLGKGTVLGYLIDRLDQIQNLHAKPSLSGAYNIWENSRDNPSCIVEQGMMNCP